MKRRKLEDWWERHQEDVQPERISEELGKVGMSNRRGKGRNNETGPNSETV